MTSTEVAQPPRRTSEAATRLLLLSVVYLVLLAWAVLWKLEVPWVGEAGMRVVKLVPFAATSSAGASTPFDVVVNVALFVPLGLYLGLLAPSWRWWRVAGVAAAVSLGLEVAQYVLAVGSSDLTDVVVNTAGALVGLGLLALVRRRHEERAAAVLTRRCAIATVLAVLACALVVASPVRYAAPEDVRCDRVTGRCGPPLEELEPRDALGLG
ncbi:VanZ family protein [Cellulomonas sp. Leaf334]|uniref:VanZ family protein n=1 Tax=Cellulomonas sp. Leaf334 TaxID=1736339 RepID=UPI000A5B2369|nr:VanZ family protein [Cellulomonas sp. Leaf334]